MPMQTKFHDFVEKVASLGKTDFDGVMSPMDLVREAQELLEHDAEAHRTEE